MTYEISEGPKIPLTSPLYSLPENFQIFTRMYLTRKEEFQLANQLSFEERIIKKYEKQSRYSLDLGKKKQLKIPSIMKHDLEILRWYLRGLFDADGTFPKHPDQCKQVFVDVTFKDKSFIEEIRAALCMFSVQTLAPKCRRKKSPSSQFVSQVWELQIRNREMIRRFLKEIGFWHLNKRLRVEAFKGRVA